MCEAVHTHVRSGAGGVALPANLNAAQLQAIKANLLKSLGILRNMSTCLGERLVRRPPHATGWDRHAPCQPTLRPRAHTRRAWT